MTHPMFQTLKNHYQTTKDRRIETLMSSDRLQNFTAHCGDMRFDFSKTNIDDEALAQLLELLEKQQVSTRRDDMFGGAKINETEGRAVLHTALRNQGTDPIVVDGADVLPNLRKTYEAMSQFAHSVRKGGFVGQGGAITDVINIGIGGSDLGPAMAVQALAPYCDGPKCHFVSNVDPSDIDQVLKNCAPETTLVIVASKTFTTIETMTNAKTAYDWMSLQVKNPGAQFAALSTATDKTKAFGIDLERVFGFEDWVGGRYSMWGPIGLSLMIAIGPERFTSFLEGGYEVDQHFQTAPWSENLPALLALVGIWHNQICDFATRAVLPYDQNLARLPAYLQQLEMESNGKGVSMDGETLTYHSGPVVWGEPGTNGQHAFYQLIHQGTRPVPCEFMVAARGHSPDLHAQHQLLVANCLAQSEALMVGRTVDEARMSLTGKFEEQELERQARHRVFTGNRPSTTLTYPQLTPFVLGQIIALYEHRVFVEGVILGINSYDQWGVELGKELATALQPIVEGAAPAASKDASTQSLILALQQQGL